MKIGISQMRCEKAALDANLEWMRQQLHAAARQGVQILAFPEMCYTGYADPNKYPEAVLNLAGPEIARLAQATRGYPVTVLAGFIEANPPHKPYITHLVLREGQILGVYRKVTIKDEETDWFSPGEEIPVFQQEGLTYGIAICADIDNEAVFARLAEQGARLVFEVAAPGLYGEQAARDWQAGFNWWREKCQDQLSGYAKKYRMWIAVATQAGRTVDEDFPGGGYLFAPDGSRVFATPDWSPGVVFLDLDKPFHSLSAHHLDDRN